MDSPSVQSFPLAPGVVSMLTPLLARKVAAQLLNDHPNWTRAEAAEYLRGHLNRPSDAGSDRFIAQVLDRWPTQDSAGPIASGTSDASTPARAFGWRSPSVWVLIATNLIPLYGVFFLGWSVFPILLLYWIENAINGLSTIMRMLCVDPADPAAWAGKAFMIPFFCVHYGGFLMVHAMLLFGFFAAGAVAPMHGSPFSLTSKLHAVSQAVTHYQLGLTVWAIAISYTYAFFSDYIARGEYRRASLSQLMNAPYGRVILLHVVILFGGFAVQALHSPVWALVMLVGLKITIDLGGRIRQARRFAQSP